MREYWKKKFNEYTANNVEQKALEIKARIESYLLKIQQASTFIHGAIIKSSMIGISTNHISNIINFYSDFIGSITPRPKYGTVLKETANDGTGLIFSFPSENTFQLFSLLYVNETHYRLCKYNEEDIVDGFNLTEKCEEKHVFEDFQTHLDNDYEEGLSWTFFKVLSSNTTMNNNYKVANDDGSTSFTCFHIEIDDFADFVDSFAKTENCEYMMLNSNNQVLFGTNYRANNTGIWSSPVYPYLNETNRTIWNNADAYFNITDLQIQNHDIDERNYAFISVPINTTLSVTHRLLMICDTSEIVFESYTLTSTYFVFYFTVILCIIFIGLIIGKYIVRKQETELASLASSPELFGTMNAGVLYMTIQRIHKLELNYPDEVILNKTLDECVNKIASQHLHPFSCVADCPFCKELIQEEPEILPDDTEDCFVSWQSLFAESFATYKNLGDIKFQWGMHKENPSEQLVKLFMTIIHKDKLYFPEVDPDFLLKMVSDFSTSYCTDPLLSAYQLNTVYYMMHTQFKYWAPNKADLFALYLASLFMNADIQAIQDYIIQLKCKNGDVDAPEKFEREQKIIGSEQIEEFGNMFITDFIYSYIPSLKVSTKFTEHFKWLFKHFLAPRSFSNYFPIFGKFRLILESPHFAPMERMFDRRDFLLYILVFGNISPYWAPTSFVDDAARHLTKRCGIEINDNAEFAKFNIAVEKTLVAPNLITVSKFIQIDPIIKNSESAIQMWEKTVEACAAEENQEQGE